MSLKFGTWSLTRPRYSHKAYGVEPWQDRAGLGLAVAGAMLLAVFFVLTAVIAGWVSGLHGSEAGNLSLVGRVNTYEAWLFPVSVAAIALAKLGIGVILFGIVRRLWTRVEGVRESLPALVGHSCGN